MKSLFVVVFLCFVSAALCVPQSSLTVTTCVGSGLSWYDASSSYTATTPASQTMRCIASWETACNTYAGVTTCNSYYEKCVNIGSAANTGLWTTWAPTKIFLGSQPQACVSDGIYLLPDAGVVIVAQIIFSFIFLVLGFFVVVLGVKSQLPTISVVVAGVLLVFCAMLLFSYYYLNAIIMMAATYGAVALFSTKRADLTMFGMFLCLFALLWVTYGNGLGFIQHQSRVSAGPSYNDTYEKYCNMYYRGYFYRPSALRYDNENPQVLFGGFCNRMWLAAELFFMIMSQLLLVVLVASGAHAYSSRTKAKSEAVEETAAAN